MPRSNAPRFPDPKRLPPTGPTAPPLACARSFALRAATDAPALPPMAQLPTCFHGPCWPARPKGLPPIRRSPHATCRLSTSAIESIPEHTFEPSSPPRFVRRHAAARRGGEPSCEISPTELSQARAAKRIRLAPTAMTAHRSGLTPTYSTRTPHVASSCLTELGNRLCEATVR